MSIYNQRQEDAMISRLIDEARLMAGPPPPVRTYIDPAGGFLRIEGHAPSPAQTARLVRAMGGAMAKLAAGSGACTEADLQALGFTTTEIATWRDEALRVARRMGGADA